MKYPSPSRSRSRRVMSFSSAIPMASRLFGIFGIGFDTLPEPDNIRTVLGVTIFVLNTQIKISVDLDINTKITINFYHPARHDLGQNRHRPIILVDQSDDAVVLGDEPSNSLRRPSFSYTTTQLISETAGSVTKLSDRERIRNLFLV